MSGFFFSHRLKIRRISLPSLFPLCSLLFLLLPLCSCALVSQSQDKNEAFERLTRQIFCQEVSSSSISLHYTLRNPEAYGLENLPVSYGEMKTSSSASSASIENLLASLESFQDAGLSKENELTLQILTEYLETASQGAPYVLYQEPLSPVIGIHAQLPVLLSEYPFYTADDIPAYFELLADTGNYFHSIADFECQKSEKGLFMTDAQAENVLEQCRAFSAMTDENCLFTTFSERLDALPNLTDSEKESLCKENKALVLEHVLPAYSALADRLESLIGTGRSTGGLCSLPDGKSYYSYLVRQTCGLSETVPELQEMAKRQIAEDLLAMQKLALETTSSNRLTAEVFSYSVPRNPGQPAIRSSASIPVLESFTPDAILSDLKSKITSAFPTAPSPEIDIKYVSQSMEEYLSPAFYMIPPIDSPAQNVIYINRAQTAQGLQLYTTLAHEGYPGHLYQTTYYSATDPDPLRNLLDFGGYVEGWATYAEMMSYYLAPIPAQEAALYQKNNSIILGLYAMADMGIHYDGWTVKDFMQYFQSYGIGNDEVLRSIYDQIAGTPANYLKYYLGYVKFYELKKETAAKLGDDFSQTDFHRVILDTGPAPFDIIEKELNKAF